MKKGQKVRVKGSNRVGMIADSTFFIRAGKKQVSYAVKFDKTPEPVWYPREELVSPMEKLRVDVSGECGSLRLDFEIDWSSEESAKVSITGEPVNLKEHKGSHLTIAGLILESLGVQ